MITSIPLYLIGLVWLVAASIRMYQQARFYQIEEYKSLRYIRWLFAERGRWLPARPVVAALAGGTVGLFVGDTVMVTVGILLVAAGIAAYPLPAGEVKKVFVRTARATRILSGGFALALLLVLLSVQLSALLPSGELALVGMFGMGFVVWALAPFLLVGGNILMTPVEMLIRWRFRQQARAKLQRVAPVVIGITGSYGKTSTKTYIAHVLNGKFRAFPTPKSWNTVMGVCLAINTKMEDDAQYFICEMGAYVRGEIQEISALTKPTIGIVTEVGPQHLERFGSLENIAIAKYEIIKGLPPHGVGVFNWDNPYIREMVSKGYPQTQLTVGKDPLPADAGEHPRFHATNITETLDGIRFTLTDRANGNSILLETPLVGQHNVINVLIAAAVGVHAGMTLEEVVRRTRTLQPAEARLVRNILPNGMTIINDAYSANPVGAVSALRVLAMHTQGRRLLITPGMVELGELHEQENYKLGEAAAEYATDIILVGEKQTRPIYNGLQAVGFPPERLQVMATVSEAIAWYQTHLGANDTVLFLNDLPDTY